MNKYILKKFLFLFVLIGFVPSIASAASVYVETSKSAVSAGDTFIVTVVVDPENTAINSIEGDIVLDSKQNSFVVNDFSLARSVFSLWPRTPSLSKEGNVISFVGGTPGGFDAGKATIFNIVVETRNEGEIKISPKDIVLYANDGKGTKVPVKLGDSTVSVGAKKVNSVSVNEWSNLVASDKTNPEDFAIVVGRDNSLFEGKRFAFFTAIDNQSGISYYEVSENGKAAIRSGSMYILENQDDNVEPKLEVTAYDKAGNKTISVYKEPGFTIYGFSLNFFIILAVIIIIYFVFKKIRKNKKNIQVYE